MKPEHRARPDGWGRLGLRSLAWVSLLLQLVAGTAWGQVSTEADAATGLPIPGVCVYVGAPSGCPTPNLNTDTSGNFAFDFQIGTAALFNFEHPLYVTPPQRTGTAINLALVRR